MKSRRRRWWLWSLLGLAAVAGGLALWWYWPEPEDDFSGEDLFHRRDFGSAYSVGVPYALALAARDRYPDILGKDRDEFCALFGVLRNPADPDGLPVGFALRRDRRTGADFLMTNCALCHTAQIDGKHIKGLGNRNLRLNALNHAILRVAGDKDFTSDRMLPAAEAAAKRYGVPWDWRSRFPVDAAVKALKELASAEAAKPDGGLLAVDAGPGRNTPVEFAKTAYHVPLAPPHGFVKYPAVWMYKWRKSFGYDGALVGDLGVALSAVESNKGVPAQDVLAQPQRWARLYDYVKSVEPPPYPHPIDKALAERGSELFQEICARCHGTYEPDGAVSYKERIVALDGVKTDPDRLRSVSPELIEARRQGELGKRIHLEVSEGYVPPPLTGVWCRGPYLHNGAVPTLADMLRPAEERPVAFYVGDVGYDLSRVGLPYEEERTADGKRAGRQASPRQRLFDTHGPGNGNGGHAYGTRRSADERKAILEYLKGL
jgi:mono/diheme cytochrome c family protein